MFSDTLRVMGYALEFGNWAMNNPLCGPGAGGVPIKQTFGLVWLRRNNVQRGACAVHVVCALRFWFLCPQLLVLSGLRTGPGPVALGAAGAVMFPSEEWGLI